MNFGVIMVYGYELLNKYEYTTHFEFRGVTFTIKEKSMVSFQSRAIEVLRKWPDDLKSKLETIATKIKRVKEEIPTCSDNDMRKLLDRLTSLRQRQKILQIPKSIWKEGLDRVNEAIRMIEQLPEVEIKRMCSSGEAAILLPECE